MDGRAARLIPASIAPVPVSRDEPSCPHRRRPLSRLEAAARHLSRCDKREGEAEDAHGADRPRGAVRVSRPSMPATVASAFDHVGIAVSDLAACERFCRTVLRSRARASPRSGPSGREQTGEPER